MHSSHLRGVLSMLGAVAVFAVMDALLKFLAAHYGPMQVAFIRGATSLPFVVAVVLVRGRFERLRMVNVRLHLLRGAIAVVMLAGFIYAVRGSSLANTYAIFMCAPLIVAALSVPMLGERVAPAQWVAITVGLGGVLLMLRPSGGDWVSLASLAAAFSALCYSFAAITMRLLARTDTTESMVFWFAVLLTVGAGLLSLPGWRPLLWDDWPLYVGVGACGALAQHLMTEAFRHAPVSVVTPLEYTALVWGMLLDLVVWQVLPDAGTLVGGAVVVGAGLYVIHREAAKRKAA